MNETYNLNSLTNNNQNKKKYLIIAVISAILIGTVTSILIISGNSKENANIKGLYDKSNPILVEKNDKYGYINSNGKELTEIKYEEAQDFQGNYGVVSYTKKVNGYNQDLYQLIDKSGKEVLKKDADYKPEYLSEYGIWMVDEVLYDNDLKRITDEEIDIVDYLGYGMFYYVNDSEDEAGIIDYTSKIRFKLEETDSLAADISDTDKALEQQFYATVAVGHLDYIVDLNTGKIIHEIKGKQYLQSTFDNNVFMINDPDDVETKTFLYVYDGKVAYKSDKITFLKVINPEKNILKIDNGKDYQYYYVNSNKYLDYLPEEDIYREGIDTYHEYEEFYCFVDGEMLFGIKKGEQEILQCKYKDIRMLEENLFKYFRNEKKQDVVLVSNDVDIKLLDLKTKKEIATIAGDFTVYGNTSETPFIVILKDDKKYVYNLLTQKQQEISKSGYANCKSNYIVVEEDNKTTYYNFDLKEIYVVNE